MILNLIDNRRMQYRWKRIKAVAEPTWHDNKCDNADQAQQAHEEFDYEEQNNISVNAAIKWANDLPFLITLYLYDAT